MLTINTNVMALNAQLALSRQTQKINQLSKVITAANAEGSEFSVGGPAASIVPTYVTSAIAGTAKAISNVDAAKNLLYKENSTVSDMITQINTMSSARSAYQGAISTGEQNYFTDIFDTAKTQLYLDISSNVYNGVNLSNGVKSDGGNFNFQIGPNPQDKIVLNLGEDRNLTADISTLASASINTDSSIYDTPLAALNRVSGSVNATISQLGFIKSRLEYEYDKNTQYRSDLLSDTFVKANTELTVQRMLQSAAQAILAQANASTDGIIELIKSARVGYA